MTSKHQSVQCNVLWQQMPLQLSLESEEMIKFNDRGSVSQCQHLHQFSMIMSLHSSLLHQHPVPLKIAHFLKAASSVSSARAASVVSLSDVVDTHYFAKKRQMPSHSEQRRVNVVINQLILSEVPAVETVQQSRAWSQGRGAVSQVSVRVNIHWTPRLWSPLISWVWSLTAATTNPTHFRKLFQDNSSDNIVCQPRNSGSECWWVMRLIRQVLISHEQAQARNSS